MSTQALRRFGVYCDVFAANQLYTDVGSFAELPTKDSGVPTNWYALGISSRSAVWIVGSWVWAALPIASLARIIGVPVLYSPKGQLCRVEFTGFAALYKALYFWFIEFLVIALSKKIIFTSKLERMEMRFLRQIQEEKYCILPEAFDVDLRCEKSRRANTENPLTFGFIAQVS